MAVNIDRLIDSIFSEGTVDIEDGETIDTVKTNDYDFEDTLSGIINDNPSYDISDLSDRDPMGCSFDGVVKEKKVKVNNESYLIRVTVRKLQG